MSTAQKLREKFLARPYRNDITYDEVVTFLAAYDFSVRKKDSGSSHTVFVRAGMEPLVIASVSGKGIKSGYIKKISEYIQQIEEELKR